MKKYLILPLLFIAIQSAFGRAASFTHPHIFLMQPATDSLDVYAGKYQMKMHGDTFYLEILVVGHELILHSLWDDNKTALKQVSGGNFIVAGEGWAIKFSRDKDGKVNNMVARGADHWTRVKS